MRQIDIRHRLRRNEKGETLIEGVCAMALILIALAIMKKSALTAMSLLKNANMNDSAYYSSLFEHKTRTISITVQSGGNLYNETDYEIKEYKNSGGLFYFSNK